MLERSDRPREEGGDRPGPQPTESPEPRDRPPMEALLRGLAASLAEVVGPEKAEETLFRLGRRLGAQGSASSAGSDPREKIRGAVEWLEHLGLGGVDVREVDVAADGEPRGLLGHVADPGRGADEPSLCALTAGLLAGAARRATGSDLVGGELGCREECPPEGCELELRVATRRPTPRKTNGTARFYLDSMGGALSESEISLSDLVENTEDAILLIDRDHVIRFWNAGAERMFQYPREEVVGTRIGFLVPPDLMQADELGQLDEQLDREGRVLDHETRRVRRDGVELRVGLTRTLLHDGQGRPIGSTAILRDVTELRRQEEELLSTRTLAVLGRLAAKVAHEIKNPLAGISGAIQVLRRGLLAGDPGAEVYDDILAEVARLDDTVRDLLRYSRPSPARPSPTELRSFVEDLVESLGCRHELADHRLDLDLPGELVLPLDTKLMGPVLTNLLHNASQSMAQAGAIHLRVHEEDDQVRIEVEDEGPGISPDLADQVFEPFFTTKSRGTGLGLAIARKNVELLGGRLELDGGSGGGACFRVVLPHQTDRPG